MKQQYHLTDVVLNHSEADSWSAAVQEWKITGFKVDPDCSSQCVCGKESIKYLFTITNDLNHFTLHPIGSKCIKKFGRQDLSDEVNVCEQMAKLLEAVEQHKYIEFSSKYFSRKLLMYLYKNGCFPRTEYNHGIPGADYRFLLDIFNSRHEPSAKQQGKVKALIMTAIIPFCRKKLEEKS